MVKEHRLNTTQRLPATWYLWKLAHVTLSWPSFSHLYKRMLYWEKAVNWHVERAWYIVGMLLNVNYLSDSLSCVTKCSLSDSPVHISLLAFLHVVLLKGCSLPLFLIPHPHPVLSFHLHSWVQKECVLFLSWGSHIYLQKEMWARWVTLSHHSCLAKRTGGSPQWGKWPVSHDR